MRMNDFGLRATSALAAAVLVAAMSFAQAADKPSKADIEAAVSDRTYQGSMLDNGFAEYYDAKGNITGKGYTGKWRADDGAMCFQYGDGAERCFEVSLEGPAMTMYKNGKLDGNGILVPGNPQNF